MTEWLRTAFGVADVVLEVIGTVAFAVSGAMTAISKKMDVLGVCILGMVTAVGGGIVRDLLLGITPPTALREPIYVVISVLVSIIVFLPGVRRKINRSEKTGEIILLVMDSLGLGIFTVIGIRTAYRSSEEINLFLIIITGVLTGTGGGLLRDIMSGNLPYIFVKHFYATASIIGSLICALMWGCVHEFIAMAVSAAIIFALRLLAAKFRWHLPKPKDA